MAKSHTVEHESIPGSHASEVFQRRNRAFRVMYDTVFDVEGLSGQELFDVLCRNLRAITEAEVTALASYNPKDGTVTLQAVDIDPDCGCCVVSQQLGETVAVSQETADIYSATQVRECLPSEFCLPDIFPDSVLSAIPSLRGNQSYGISCVHENELAAIGMIGFNSDQKFRMKDLVDSYLNLAGMIIQRENALAALRESEAEAKAGSTAKSEFLANMSHEIRTPMNCIIGIADLLLQMEHSHNQKYYLDMIRQSGSSLLTLINDILDISKIEAGQLVLDLIEFPLHAFVDEVVKLIGFSAQSQGLEVLCRLAPECPVNVVLDPCRLRQVLTNLLNNANKFTKTGHILLNVEPAGVDGNTVMLKFEVTDTGIGIDEAKLNTIFEKFTQADASTTRRFGGTGLGLSISQHMVHKMGGRISAQSTVGQGSTFSFTIPTQTKSGLTDIQKPSAQDKHNILVLSGYRPCGCLLVEQVQALGHDCIVAETMAEALSLAADSRSRPWTRILVDQEAAEFELSEIMEYLDGIAPEKRPDLLMMNKISMLVQEDEVAEMGFAGSVNKPISLKRLESILADRKSAAPVATSLVDDSTSESVEKPEFEACIENANILLVEDNPFNQKVASAMLENLGCRVTVVNDGLEALNTVREIQYDLVFMDCQMPEMDGYEATRQIRQLADERRHTLIVAMTANALAGDRQACLDAGMDDFLSKPISLSTLKAMLEKRLLACPETASV